MPSTGRETTVILRETRKVRVIRLAETTGKGFGSISSGITEKKKKRRDRGKDRGWRRAFRYWCQTIRLYFLSPCPEQPIFKPKKGEAGGVGKGKEHGGKKRMKKGRGEKSYKQGKGVSMSPEWDIGQYHLEQKTKHTKEALEW